MSISMDNGGTFMRLMRCDIKRIIALITDRFFESEDHKRNQDSLKMSPPAEKDWGKYADEVEGAIVNLIGRQYNYRAEIEEIFFYILWRTNIYLRRMVQAHDICLNCWESSGNHKENCERERLYDPGFFLDATEAKVSETIVEPERTNQAFSLPRDFGKNESWLMFLNLMADEKLDNAIKKHLKERLEMKISSTTVWFDLWMIMKNAWDFASLPIEIQYAAKKKRLSAHDIERLEEAIKKGDKIDSSDRLAYYYKTISGKDMGSYTDDDKALIKEIRSTGFERLPTGALAYVVDDWKTERMNNAEEVA